MKSIKTIAKKYYNACDALDSFVNALKEELIGKVLTPSLRKKLVAKLAVEDKEHEISIVIYDDACNDFSINDDDYDSYFRDTRQECKELITITDIYIPVVDDYYNGCSFDEITINIECDSIAIKPISKGGE